MAIAIREALHDDLDLDALAVQMAMPASRQGRLVSGAPGLPAFADPEESPGAFGYRVYVIASHFSFLRPKVS